MKCGMCNAVCRYVVIVCWHGIEEGNRLLAILSFSYILWIVHCSCSQLAIKGFAGYGKCPNQGWTENVQWRSESWTSLKRNTMPEAWFDHQRIQGVIKDRLLRMKWNRQDTTAAETNVEIQNWGSITALVFIRGLGLGIEQSGIFFCLETMVSLIKQSFHFHPTRFQSEQLLDVPMKPAALLCPKFVLVMMTKEN